MLSSLRISATQRTLLDLLSDPARARSLGLRDWESVIRLARMARLLATLRHCIETDGSLAAVPDEARRHLDSDAVVSRHRRQMMEWEMATIAKALAGYDGPVVWLKGASYIAQRLPIAEGRLPADVDVMVPRDRLGEVEAVLRGAGWTSQELSAYDERYYRDWSHELPPMQHAGQPLELDLHHTILPVTGRLRPDAEALFAASVALPDTRVSVLSAHDQVLHAAAQLFQDSDCNDRLRDLVDLDGLLRFHARDSRFWGQLSERASSHELNRPLWYALRYCAVFLRTPVPANMLDEKNRGAPASVTRFAMDRLVPDALLPANPDFPPSRRVRLAKKILLARSQWLRMPPWLLVKHLWHKVAVVKQQAPPKPGDRPE